MKISRTPEEVTIQTKYKISKRKVHNKQGVSYQYFVRVPPLLISFFNFSDYTKGGYNPNSIVIYEYENRFYLVDSETFYNIGNTNSTINMKIKDSVRYTANLIQVNKVPNNNGFQFTLPLKQFKPLLNPHENQYLLYTLHTGKEDIAYIKGLCEIEIITE